MRQSSECGPIQAVAPALEKTLGGRWFYRRVRPEGIVDRNGRYHHPLGLTYS
jgi:hypothetical protein